MITLSRSALEEQAKTLLNKSKNIENSTGANKESKDKKEEENDN